MVSNKDSSFVKNPLATFNTGLNLLVIAISVIFVAIVVMIVILVKCRSKSLKKKNSICEEEGYSVDSGVLKPNILSIKRTLSENSDSSDDILYETDRRFVVDKVQPKRSSLRSQKSVSSVDSEADGIPTIVISLVTEGDTASVTLIKAKNLRRSGFSSSDKLIPEGVFARIYPKLRNLSTDSSQTDSEQQKSSGNDFFETSFVKSKKSKFIKFDENQTFRMSAECFPIRISVYEMDKQKIRHNIGHTFLKINTRDNFQTNQIIELELFSTLFKAKNSYLNQK